MMAHGDTANDRVAQELRRRRPRLQRSRHSWSGIESAAAKEPAMKQGELFCGIKVEE